MVEQVEPKEPIMNIHILHYNKSFTVITIINNIYILYINIFL